MKFPLPTGKKIREAKAFFANLRDASHTNQLSIGLTRTLFIVEQNVVNIVLKFRV